MNKKILLSIVVVSVLLIEIRCIADEGLPLEKTVGEQVEKNIDYKPSHKRPPFEGDENFMKPHHQNMHISKAEMEKKKAEFEKRLKLTNEQKKLIEENRKKSHEKVKPIFEQKKLKMDEIREIYKNNSLTEEQKKEKIEKLKIDIKKLNEQANVYRKENMNSFESILTETQKKEFSKIKLEQKKDMEKRKAKMKKKIQKMEKNREKFKDIPPFEKE